MKIIQGLQQGSEAWLAHRRTTRNASDAPAMMGASPYVSRAELIRRVATGVEPEIDPLTQKRFDDGHKVEPLLRAIAEAIIGEDLYPATGVSDDGYLGASFDGVTMLEDTILEAKQSNAEKIACIGRDEIPPQDYWQIVQQFAVCESAKGCIYMVGDGTDEGSHQLLIPRDRIEADIPKLIAGWQQFDADVAAYVPEAAAEPVAVGRAPEQLPALSVIARGMVEQSNHHEFRERALAAIAAVNRDLQTDDDFATAELTVKSFKAGEDMLEATRQQILGQMADVNEVMRTIDEVQGELRRVRLDLDKLVTREKENRKAEIVRAAVSSVSAHIASINATLGEHALQVPSTLQAVIGAAIKGKRTISSIKDAADSAAAQQKIDASQRAERTRACIAVLAEHPDHASLFADRVQLCATKQPEDLRNLVAARITEHNQREAARLEQERERIRKEEQDRIEREQAEKAAADSSHGIATAGGVPDSGEVPDRVRHMTGSGSHVQGAGTPAADGPTTAAVATVTASPPCQNFAPAKRLKLGDINAAIAPLTITADGLAQLGFTPVASKGAAKLYAGSDFPAICQALADVIAEAPQQIGQQEAA